MDEILIEEKRYISSKRAAKVTGYAKDYVGQLCREGRVPARLVGRNWYVLETAIHDHRFGPQADEPVRSAEVSESRQELDSPRYEAFSASDAFPRVARSRQDESEPASAREDQSDASQHLQDSWKEWFERIADTAASAISDVSASEKSPESVESEKEQTRNIATDEKGEEEEEEGKEVRIPIRAIHHQPRYQTPPEEFLPRRYDDGGRVEGKVTHRMSEFAVSEVSGKGMSMGRIVFVRIVGVFIAAIAVSLAILGTGYMDTYIISFRQVEVFSGITTLDK